MGIRCQNKYISLPAIDIFLLVLFDFLFASSFSPLLLPPFTLSSRIPIYSLAISANIWLFSYFFFFANLPCAHIFILTGICLVVTFGLHFMHNCRRHAERNWTVIVNTLTRLNWTTEAEIELRVRTKQWQRQQQQQQIHPYQAFLCDGITSLGQWKKKDDDVQGKYCTHSQIPLTLPECW